MVLTFIGSGGKSTAIFTLADRLRKLGKRVLVTTTTHMHTPDGLAAQGRALPLCEGRYCSLSGEAADILKRLRDDGFCFAGLLAAEEGKMAPLPQGVYEAACAGADVVLVEADGSRSLPLKYPAEHEPVIPGNTNEIIVLCGLSALGQPLSRVTHRLALALAALNAQSGQAPVTPDSIVTPALIARLTRLGYLEPLRRRFPNIPVRLYPSQAVTLYQRCAAALLGAGLDTAPLREEWFSPPPHLVLLGGGHVAHALYRLALVLEWRVTVLDNRPAFAQPARFPGAQVIHADFSALEKALPAEPGAWYAVMTHGHQWDLACVQAVLRAAPRRGYLGLMGSRTKVSAAFAALEGAGFSQEDISSIHAPIGLKLGGVSPAEVAVSIAGELIQIKCAGGPRLPKDLMALDHKAGLRGVFALVLEREGSVPSRPGSLLVLEDSGQLTGTVGGGALELRVLERLRALAQARRELRESFPPAFPPPDTQIMVCDTSPAGGGDRVDMACGGRVTILLGCLEA